MYEKNYIWNPGTCTYENGKYLGSIIDDLVITYDKIPNYRQCVANAISNVPTNLHNQKSKI